MAEVQFGINISCVFFSEGSYSFRLFQGDEEFIPDPTRSYICLESTFAKG